MLTFIDLFSGIGGFRLGMEMAGHKCLGHCEIDKFANISYIAMHRPKEGEWYESDITRVRASDIPRADVWCFGFPCQDISVAGKQKGFSGNRSSLFFTVTGLIRDIKEEDRPKYLFIENVKNLLSINRGFDFLKVLIELDEIGYNVEWQVLNSKDFGVPQNRERIFIIGHLKGRSGREVFPIERANGAALMQVIGGMQGYRVYDPSGISCTLVGNAGGAGAKTGLYAVNKMIKIGNINPSGRGQGGNVFSVNGISPTLTTGKGEGQKILVKDGTKKGYAEAIAGDSINLAFPNSKTRRGRVGKGISQTLDTSCQIGTLDKSFRIRRLTPLECFRLQGFPDEYFDRVKEVNSDSQLYKQAGNSVTVNVIYEIARRLEDDFDELYSS